MKILKFIGVVLAVLLAFTVGMRAVYANKVLPNTYIGVVDVGGLTKAEALEKVQQRTLALEEEGIMLVIEDKTDQLHPTGLVGAASYELAVKEAILYGRTGNLISQINQTLNSPWSRRVIELPLPFDENFYNGELESLQNLYSEPGTDVRLHIDRTVVKPLYDVSVGKVLDVAAVKGQLYTQLKNLDNSAIDVPVVIEEPVISADSAANAVVAAERMLAEDLRLKHSWRLYKVERAKIGSWIDSGSEGRDLIPVVNEVELAKYVAELGEEINNIPETADITLDREGKVVDFIPPTSGEALEEAETIDLIKEVLLSRRDETGRTEVTEISLPVSVQKPRVSGTAAELGIEELIGVATTTFSGSPENRRFNIANGAKFLTGILVPPGEEFSTIQSLGVIDNTTGYLPELVIKGDRTIPEYGGGLCQVSTTLFRSVLNAGLPVTSRRNHSYRVGYYEKDANGEFIGPGLDATIYDPAPDFRFKNDTEGHILVRGYVNGDLITFELFGKKDGRVATVDGPHTLSTTPPGDPIYAETDELKAGEIKRIESAHPGGTARATYTVVYPDGRTEEQEFNSYYRPWPERFLVGTGTDPSEYLSEEKQKELSNGGEGIE